VANRGWEIGYGELSGSISIWSPMLGRNREGRLGLTAARSRISTLQSNGQTRARREGVKGQKRMGIEPTSSPPSALGSAVHLPSLFQPPPQGYRYRYG
jgi:hypothetical protein